MCINMCVPCCVLYTNPINKAVAVDSHRSLVPIVFQIWKQPTFAVFFSSFFFAFVSYCIHVRWCKYTVFVIARLNDKWQHLRKTQKPERTVILVGHIKCAFTCTGTHTHTKLIHIPYYSHWMEWDVCVSVCALSRLQTKKA